jgi:hypothetical protein
MEDRLTTVLSYKTINKAGVTTIKAEIEIADQSPKSASGLLLGLLDGISKIPKAQVEG